MTLILRTQNDVNAFPCATVAGGLYIYSKTSITSLSPGLDKLTRVGGLLELRVDNTFGPANLKGLDSLTHVGSLLIRADIDNTPDQLTDISALGTLASIGPINTQPCTSSANCLTRLEIQSSSITALPPWNIAGASIKSLLLNGGFSLTNPAELDTLPTPTQRLTIEAIPLDTNNAGQLTSLQRLASQAQLEVVLNGIAGVKTLPTMPKAKRLVLKNLGLTDLSSVTPSAFPALIDISLATLPNIDGSELATIRNFAKISLNDMAGLTGSNPLAGLAGGTFHRFLVQNSPNITTLVDLTSVTTLQLLIVRGLDGLTNLDGLQNLKTAGSLNFSNNSNLQNIDALANLASVGDTLTLESNKSIQNLDGLSGIAGSLQTVRINSNDQLTDISGLSGITGVSTSVFVYGNRVTECDVLVQSRLNPPPGSDYYVVPACVYSTPNLVASPTALDFGSGSIGTTIDRSVTFQNVTGSISTTSDISFVGIASDSLGEYSILNEDCKGNALTGGSTRNSCTVEVRFTVKQTGVDQAQLGLEFTTSDNASVRSLPVNLTAAGTGVAGDQLTPNTNLDFSDVELGATQNDIITIDNTGGSGPLTVSSLAVAGSDFSLVGNSCGNNYPQTVATGSQCAITVSFMPSALGARSGQFTMTSDGATSPDNVNLLGVGVLAPAPVPSSTSLDFGDVLVGTSSAQQIVGVTNQGALRSLTLGQLSVSGDFTLQALSGQCSGATLAPAGQTGSACAVAVLYNPTAPGPATGTLDIPGASGFPSASVSLAGNGLQPASLTASPTHLAFGTQTGPTGLNVTITNIGAVGQDAQIGTASVRGTQTPQQFALDTDGCSGATLAGKATCQITVQFDPSQDGADTGTLELPYNSGQTLIVALSGRGGDPVDYISPSSLSFSEEVGNTSVVVQTVTVTDNSGIALDIAAVNSLDSQFSVSNDTCAGTTVSPGGNCTFDVAFTAIAPGHVVSTIEVISNSASSPDHVIVDGIGQKPGELQLSEAAFDFGAVPPGQSGSETVAVTNIGDVDFPVGPVSLSGDSAFSLTNDTCSGVTLAAAATCSFAVSFAPATAGDVSAQVNVNPTLFLTGSGQNPAAAPKPVPTLPNLLWVLVALIGGMGARRLRRL
ncbi:MAG: choice-of-anchor D domain-containing protein [Halioglobus sp.]